MRRAVAPEGPALAGAADERLRFETLLAELAVGFGGLSPAQLDEAIAGAQRGICECLGLDRSGLWLTDPENPGDLRLSNLYLRPGEAGTAAAGGCPGDRQTEAPPTPGASVRSHFPWLLDRAKRDGLVVVGDPDELPAEAATDRRSLLAFNFRSMVLVPLEDDGALIGLLSLVKASRRLWEPALLKRLELAGRLLAISLVQLRQEAELRQSEARLASAAELAGLGFHDTRLGEPREVYLDDRLRALLGASDVPVAAVMQFWQDRLHPGDRDRIKAQQSQLWTGETARVATEYRFCHPQGETIWISHVATAIEHDAQGRASRILGVMQDITERQRAREALEKAQTHTLAVINSTDDLIWSVDPERHGLLTWNSALRDYFFTRRNIEIAVGMTPEDLLPPDFAGVWHEMYSHALREGSFTREYEVVARTNVLLLSIQPMKRAGEVFAVSVFGKDITALKHSEDALRKSLEEVTQLRNKLELENRYLQKEHQLLYGQGRIVGESKAIAEVLTAVEQVAPLKATVLIQGETGVGKELIARRVHELSPRGARALVKVNCAALPSTLVESELFGREKGAYTGSVSRELGRFEIANGSTIFLDEIAELPLELQAKLLRVLEEGEFERVGSPRTLHTDARVIAATNRDLEAEVAAGRFRRDLYYRLSAFPIRVPPLRERRGDIPLLMWTIVEEFNASMHREITSIPRRTVEMLQTYDWPGNVRELRNVIERAMIRSAGPTLEVEIPGSPTPRDAPATSLDEAQRRHIAKVIEAAGGRISGPGGAAELLGLKRTTLNSLMKRLGLAHPRSRGTADS